MAWFLRSPLLLLAALVLALAVSSAADVSPGRPLMPGGLAEADINEEGVQQALNFALNEYNKASNDAYHSRAMRVLRARKQVRPWGGAGVPGLAGRQGCGILRLRRAWPSGGDQHTVPNAQLAGGTALPCFSARQFP